MYMPKLDKKTKANLALAITGLLLGSVGASAASKTPLVTSVTSFLSNKHSSGTLAMSACVPTKQQDEIYFVSCGGTF